MKLTATFGLLKETWSAWSDDKAARLGAALAYYSIFSLAPLLMVTIGIAGLVFGEQAARGQIGAEIGSTVEDSSTSPKAVFGKPRVQHVAANLLLRHRLGTGVGSPAGHPALDCGWVAPGGIASAARHFLNPAHAWTGTLWWNATRPPPTMAAGGRASSQGERPCAPIVAGMCCC